MYKEPERISHDEFERRFWNQYLLHENDFISSLNYVEFAEENFETYSIQFVKQLLSVSSEIESVLKIMFCNKTKRKSKDGTEYAADKNMVDYIKDLQGLTLESSNIENIIIKSYRLNYEFVPFKLKPKEETPSWWKNHNKLKHNRSEEYKCANLYNLVNALAGLFLLNYIYFKFLSKDRDQVDTPNTISKIFKHPFNLNIFRSEDIYMIGETINEDE